MSSPITSRTNAQPLSLDLLKKYVPDVRAGQEAILILKEQTELTDTEKNNLLATKMIGTKAQEILIISALPLIKNLSSQEFQRRKAWSSRISYDDVLQEAIAGFIRGLLSYNETANHTSPTNYLGQWITTSIRRKVEKMEHDFIIPFEVVERARRIRAVRSRLQNEMSRHPTDDEVLDSLNDPDSYGGNKKWGRPKVVDPTKPVVKKFTQSHLDEARDLVASSYGLPSYDIPTSDTEESYEKASTPLTISDVESSEVVDERDLSNSRLNFFTATFVMMKMGERQQDVILRTFGLGVYVEPQIQKEIIAETGLPPRFVKTVISEFSIYMPLTGGVFHKMLLETSPMVIEGLEMEWLLPRLGEWPKKLKKPIPPPAILTQPGTRSVRKAI